MKSCSDPFRGHPVEEPKAVSEPLQRMVARVTAFFRAAAQGLVFISAPIASNLRHMGDGASLMCAVQKPWRLSGLGF